MGEPHVVSGLREKRAEISGTIEDMERRIAQQRADLMHVDAVLRLYAPELVPGSIAPKAVRRRNDWFRPGELSRIVLDILREAAAPLALREIAAEVMIRRRLDPNDQRTAYLLHKLVNNAVTRQAAQVVEKITDGRAVTWQVRG